jgi:hypothetical protein
MAHAPGLEHPGLLVPVRAQPLLSLRPLAPAHCLSKPLSRPASSRSPPSAPTFPATDTSRRRPVPSSTPTARVPSRSPARGGRGPTRRSAAGVRRLCAAHLSQDPTLLETRAATFAIRDCVRKAAVYGQQHLRIDNLQRRLFVDGRSEQCARFARHPRDKLGERRHRV